MRRAAVLGSPIGHSLSPALHRAAYSGLGLDWTYDAIEMSADALAGFLAGCSAPEWAGLSLTMPLKAEVLPLLDDVDGLAAMVGAANTVVFDERGSTGYNTDVPGMRRALEERGVPAGGVGKAVVVGAGATARSAVAALAAMGAQEVVVWARTPDRAVDLGRLGDHLGVSTTVRPWRSGPAGRPSRPYRADPADLNGDVDLTGDVVISTVPPGAADPLVAAVPERPGTLLDVAYGDADSALVRAWRARGAPAADGLDLLLWQAVDQVRLMTGLDPDPARMRAALVSARR